MLNLQRESLKANKQRLKVKQQNPFFSFQANIYIYSVNKYTDILYLSNVTEINFIIGNSISLHVNRAYVLASIEENSHLTNESADLQTSRTHLAKREPSQGRIVCTGTTLPHSLAFSFMLFHSLLSTQALLVLGMSRPECRLWSQRKYTDNRL